MSHKISIFFAILGFALVLIAGCVSPQPPPATPIQTTLTTPEITPVPTTVTPVITTSPPVTFTRDQVNQLFIDIAFGCDNTGIHKFSPSPDNHLFFSLEGVVTSDDIDFATQFAKNYDLMTSVDAFSDDPLSNGGSQIVFYPPDSLNSLSKTYIGCQELDPQTGTPLYMIYRPLIEYPSGQKVQTTKIYINADLAGAERDHYLERAMLYYLGFPGQTYTYPDSVFYYNTRSNVNFIPIDAEAIKTMYNPGIYTGMGVQEARYYLLNT